MTHVEMKEMEVARESSQINVYSTPQSFILCRPGQTSELWLVCLVTFTTDGDIMWDISPRLMQTRRCDTIQFSQKINLSRNNLESRHRQAVSSLWAINLLQLKT